MSHRLVPAIAAGLWRSRRRARARARTHTHTHTHTHTDTRQAINTSNATEYWWGRTCSRANAHTETHRRYPTRDSAAAGEHTRTIVLVHVIPAGLLLAPQLGPPLGACRIGATASLQKPVLPLDKRGREAAFPACHHQARASISSSLLRVFPRKSQRFLRRRWKNKKRRMESLVQSSVLPALRTQTTTAGERGRLRSTSPRGGAVRAGQSGARFALHASRSCAVGAALRAARTGSSRARGGLKLLGGSRSPGPSKPGTAAYRRCPETT